MTRRIDQILAGYAEGDAISGEVRWMQSAFRRFGFESEIYADRRHVSPSMQSQCRGLTELGSEPSDLVIHHYSIGSPAIDVFMGAKAKKVLIYHNITPSSFFRGYDQDTAQLLDNARTVLGGLVHKVDRLWADSAYNAGELKDLGAKAVDVFHLPFVPEVFDVPRDPDVARRLATPLTTLLFVGRIAPNKRVEDLIMAFAWYHRVINRQSRLVLVGSDRSCPRYYMMLRMLANELDLANVCFELYAAPGGLPVYYEKANLFVTASEHEGFCVPLLEAMHHGVPVLARRTGGVPEALGGAGILYEDVTAAELAVLMHKVVTDEALRREVLDSQSCRMAEIAARDLDGELRTLVERALAG